MTSPGGFSEYRPFWPERVGGEGNQDVTTVIP